MEYLHINQDTLKTREKCIKALEEALKTGKSCVIGEKQVYCYLSSSTNDISDNTNRNAATRKVYLDVCRKNDVPAR